MKTFTYNCVKVQQTPESEPFFVTSIKAKELLAWCDVPRSKEGFMAGYQRELDGREARITEFFLASPKNNIIPNAVIVAVDQNRISITGGATAVVTVRHEEKNESELLASLIEQFERRLNAE
jgi:hypothetical protein